MKYIFFILLFWSVKSNAINEPVQILRACIDNTTSTITVKWKTPEDVCGSFTKHEIYGSDNGGPFVLLDVLPNIGISEYPHTLSTLSNKWRYRIETHTACDGSTVLISNTIEVDISYPQNIELDSVSYDLNTQNIIAGWSDNPSPDTKEYEVYNYITGDGASIGRTTATNFTVSTNPSSIFPVVIATLDSCNLSSLISDSHQVSFLSTAFDTCKGEATLSWSRYEGWQSIDKQEVYISINGGNFTKIADLTSSVTTYIHSNVTLGDELVFYIRSFTTKNLSTITSSSNKSTVRTRAFNIPSALYLQLVTVENNTSIAIEWLAILTSDIYEFQLQKSVDGFTFETIKTVISNSSESRYFEKDVNVDINTNTYHYKVLAFNKCNELLLESNKSQSILLSKNQFLVHNEYVGWDKGVSVYSLEKKNISSTWNEIGVSLTGFNSLNLEDSVGCYRIAAYEIENQYGGVATSYSNEICIFDSLTVYVPTGINPLTSNNRFLVTGTGIDDTRSRYQIYTRWGELIADQPTSEPYYFYYKNTEVPAGWYLYIINLYGLLGEKRTEKGMIHVVK